MVNFLTSLPTWTLVIGSICFTLLVALGGRYAARHLVPESEHDFVAGIAAPLMPALGALFAVLIAVTVASEAGYLKSAQESIAVEAAAASRLAWASTTPGVVSAPIQASLLAYLEATRATEWTTTGEGHVDSAPMQGDISALERTVREQAIRSELGTPASTELLTSLDAVTSSRRARLAEASRQIPTLYVWTLVVSGAALVANAGVLGFRSKLRTATLAGGLAVGVALCLALLVAISEPWHGALEVSASPIDAVIDDLQAGYFEP